MHLPSIIIVVLLFRNDSKLVVVLFAEQWNLFTKHMVQEWEAIRQAQCVPFAKIFIVDMDKEREKCWHYGVAASPSVLFFWEGKPLRIQRQDWPEDTKCMKKINY